MHEESPLTERVFHLSLEPHVPVEMPPHEWMNILSVAAVGLISVPSGYARLYMAGETGKPVLWGDLSGPDDVSRQSSVVLCGEHGTYQWRAHGVASQELQVGDMSYRVRAEQVSVDVSWDVLDPVRLLDRVRVLPKDDLSFGDVEADLTEIRGVWRAAILPRYRGVTLGSHEASGAARPYL